MGTAINHKGKRIGFLAVIEKLPERDQWGAILWRCKCDCGKENILTSGEIARKAVISCSVGCSVRVLSNQIKNFHKKYVIAKNDCWIWTGSRDKDGYGNFLNGGKAHRFSYETFRGDISEGLYVLHKCDTPFCVNPDHLFLGDAKSNAHDCMKKGRNTRGMKQPQAKSKDQDILEMRKLYATGEKSFGDLAKIFGISRTTAYKIVRKKTWKHIE